MPARGVSVVLNALGVIACGLAIYDVASALGGRGDLPFSWRLVGGGFVFVVGLALMGLGRALGARGSPPAASRGATPRGRDARGEFKLGHSRDGGETFERFARSDVWERERTTGPERLRIGAESGAVHLMLALAEGRAPRWRVLYVLVVPRGEAERGRYESAELLSWERAEAFLRRFADFLEKDARHAVWLQGFSEDGEAATPLLVYEQHDLLYAYGELDAFERVLGLRGFRRGEVVIPAPHTHHYHATFDADARALHAELAWVRSPLRDDDDP